MRKDTDRRGGVKIQCENREMKRENEKKEG